jgi:IS1 family transposase
LNIADRSCVLINVNEKKTAEKARIIKCLCEGNSIRATSRLCGCAINTVIKLLTEVGPACSRYQDVHFRNLNSLIVQVDEIWSFVGCKQKRATEEKRAKGQGDAWTWTAIDADSKLMIAWLVGLRGDRDCQDFIDDLADRLKNRIQLSCDGYGTYNDAVKVAFGANVDYGQIVKVFGSDPRKPRSGIARQFVQAVKPKRSPAIRLIASSVRLTSKGRTSTSAWVADVLRG